VCAVIVAQAATHTLQMGSVKLVYVLRAVCTWKVLPAVAAVGWNVDVGFCLL
jgi:hypothetical protein